MIKMTKQTQMVIGVVVVGAVALLLAKKSNLLNAVGSEIASSTSKGKLYPFTCPPSTTIHNLVSGGGGSGTRLSGNLQTAIKQACAILNTRLVQEQGFGQGING